MRLRVKVNPGSRSESVRRLEPGFYQVRTRAPAENGHANRRALELLAEELELEPASARIVRGPRSNLKVGELD